MCCWNNSESRRRVLASFGKRQTKTFWRTLTDCADSPIASYEWGPGVHHAKGPKKYNRRVPRGFHVYRSREFASYVANVMNIVHASNVLVPVVCHRDDLMAADDKQAVFSRVTVPRRKWGRRFKRTKSGWVARKGVAA